MKSKKTKKILIFLCSIIVIAILVLTVRSIIRNVQRTKDIKEVAELQNNVDPALRPGLYVDGTALKDKSGNNVMMRGINHAHCWYKDKDDIAFPAIKDAGANTIRIVCANGIQWESDTKETLKKVVEKAHSLGMLAIVEIHDGTGSDDIDVLREIAGFWCDMADVLSGTEDYCIVNIANEWCGKMNASLWRDGYTEVIPMLRDAGIRNVLMIDSAGWGQFGRCIDKYGMEVFKADICANTMFSVHMYGLSGGIKSEIRNNLTSATAHGLCVAVGEMGYKHSDGNVNEDYIIEYCNKNNIGYLAWSWKGNSGGVEYLDLAAEWDGSKLTEEWGEPFINGESGLKSFK